MKILKHIYITWALYFNKYVGLIYIYLMLCDLSLLECGVLLN